MNRQCMAVLAVLFAACLALQAEDKKPEKTFYSEATNIKLSYPASWLPLQLKNKDILFGIQKMGNAILLVAGESSETLEGMAEEYRESLLNMFDKTEKLGERRLTVAGEPALELRFKCSRGGISVRATVTVLTHQGIAYRIVGTEALSKDDGILPEYNSVIASIGFLRDRPEWIAKFKGKPVRSAMLGGLCGFELNRPRWKDSTLTHKQEYKYLEHMHFNYLAGGAWISLRAKKRTGDDKAELEQLRHGLEVIVRGPECQYTKDQARTGAVPVVEITTKAIEDQVARFFRAAVISRDDLVLHMYMECLASRKEETRSDWLQLLGSMQLDSEKSAAKPPAYELQGRDYAERTDSGLAVALEKAERLLPASDARILRRISPDGKCALLSGDDEATLLDLESGKRRSLHADLPYSSNQIAFSPDNRRLLISQERELLILDLEPYAEKSLPIAAVDIAWGASPNEAFACVAVSEKVLDHHYASQRLVRIDLDTGKTTDVLSYPLAKLAHPAVSPDGQWLAVAANRDLKRTKLNTAACYVLRTDGSQLRRLTKESASIDSLSWSADGQQLYMVGSLLSPDEERTYVNGDENDLYSISVKDGTLTNLTRSGWIGGGRCIAGALLLSISNWNLQDEQCGLFRIAPEVLAKATAGRPVPAVSDTPKWIRSVRDAVVKALGTEDLQQVKPTTKLLAATAEAWAKAASQARGMVFDFSIESLDRIGRAATALRLGRDRDPFQIFGIGAYYGETLRRAAQAEWKLGNKPFGQWIPGVPGDTNPFASVELPFSSPLLLDMGAELAYLWNERSLSERDQGAKLLLVYPPGHAEEALKQETSPAYLEAVKKLDAGEVQQALDLLAGELKRLPRNASLARQVISICHASGLDEKARELTRAAVEAGNEVSELVLAYSDEVAKDDPKKAMAYLQRAAKGYWPPAEVYFKLGRLYEAQGDHAIAEACLRRGYWRASPELKAEIIELLKGDDPEALDVPTEDDE